MARGFDRRRFLGGGCALFTMSCVAQSQREDSVAPDADTDTDADTDADTDTDTTEPPTYPCGQTIDPGGAGWQELPLASWPDLAEVGGWYEVDAGGRALVVAHVTDGCYSAIFRACSHQGTSIAYKPDRGQYVCPNHGAIYAADGEAVSGPQPTGLPVFPCGRVGDSVWVQAG